MFHDIPAKIRNRMQYLERLDAHHRRDDIRHFKRLRQVPPATGKFLAQMAAIAPEGTYLEIGTSGGYSGLWLALACREVGRRLTTFEMDEGKIRLAKETFRSAGVEDAVDLVEGDARDRLGDFRNVAFCFLDAEKAHYADCYELVVPNMIRGGLLIADNVISHQQVLGKMVRRTLRDRRVDAMTVPIGSGLLMCRKT